MIIDYNLFVKKTITKFLLKKADKTLASFDRKCTFDTLIIYNV